MNRGPVHRTESVIRMTPTPNLAGRLALPRIADRFDPRSNGITGLRLFLALGVLVLHAWPVVGAQDPVNAVTGGRIPGGGTLAVLAFFGLSGFLLMDSRRRAGPAAFLWHRALRILPGYWVCIALVSLVVGWSYAAAAILPWPGVGGASWSGFSALPLDTVNASLWTLAPELTCYLVLALSPVRFLRYAVPLALVYVLLGHEAEPHYGRMTLGLITWDVTFAFAIGAALNLARGWFPLHGGLAALALVGAYASLGTGAQVYVVAFASVYVAIWAGVRLPVRWKTDLSYGVYIYAFPITQFVMLAGVGRYGPIGVALLATVVTLPVALLSWHLVERPALNAKGWNLSRFSLPVRPAAKEPDVPPLTAQLARVSPESW